jgi:hypothetical protein
MLAVLLLPIVAQAAVMAVDEGYFHRRRGLPRWERVGHPIDTLSVAAAFAWLAIQAPTRDALWIYVALAGFSCLLVTKDEPVHARVCSPGEQWAHALLFVLHPIVFLSVGVAWWSGRAAWLPPAMLAFTLGFALYQLVYWRWRWKTQARARAR